MPPEFESLLDWRHFFVTKEVGSSICGIARKAAAEYLRAVGTAKNFLTLKWHDSLRNGENNLSIVGFFTQQMLLSWISLNGCKAAGDVFSPRPDTVHFSSSSLPLPSRGPGFKFYVPVSHHFKAVDAILVHLSADTVPKATVIGVQITIAKTHSDSESLFFHNWRWWSEKLGLPEGNVAFKFLWILEDVGTRPGEQVVLKQTQPLRESEAPGFT